MTATTTSKQGSKELDLPYGFKPPAEWFTKPIDGFGPDSKVMITPEGRFTAWSHQWQSGHVSKPAAWKNQDFKPLPSPTGNAMFHRGTVTTAEGSTIEVGSIPLSGGHSNAAANDLVQAQADYDKPENQRVVGRAIENEVGTMICGSVLPGTTEADEQSMKRSMLSGDWRSIPELGGQMDYLNPCFVTVGGLPLASSQTPQTEIDQLFTQLLAGFKTETDQKGQLVRATGTNMTTTPELTPEQLEQIIEVATAKRSELVQAMAGDEIATQVGANTTAIEENAAAIRKIRADMDNADDVDVPEPDQDGVS